MRIIALATMLAGLAGSLCQGCSPNIGQLQVNVDDAPDGGDADDDSSSAPDKADPAAAAHAAATAPSTTERPADSATLSGEEIEEVEDSDAACMADALRCVSTGTAARKRCQQDGSWADDNCPDGEVCSGSAATCASVDDFCLGRGGEFVCADGVMHTCGPDGRSIEQQDCRHAERCRLGLESGACAICVPGEDVACDEEKATRCNDEGNAFEVVTTCASADLCNPQTGTCGDSVCNPGQHKCEGQSLLACNAAQTSFEVATVCVEGTTCDAGGAQCDLCQPGQSRCSEGKREQCRSDGSGFDADPCESPTPHCVGTGKCAACGSDVDCLLMGEICSSSHCNSGTGTCELQIDRDAPCVRSGVNAGFCTAEATCEECNTDLHCLLSDHGKKCDAAAHVCTQCLTDADCSDGKTCVPGQGCARVPTCGDGFLDDGEQCDDGNRVDTDACSAECKIRYYGKCDYMTNDLGSCLSYSICSPLGQSPAGQCVYSCGANSGDTLPKECPLIPSSPTGLGGEDHWQAQCVSDSLCVFQCDGAGACPPGFRCHGHSSGNYCVVD